MPSPSDKSPLVFEDLAQLNEVRLHPGSQLVFGVRAAARVGLSLNVEGDG